MLTSVLLTGYLGVGSLFGALSVYMTNEDIKNKEKGDELNDSSEERLKLVEITNNTYGGSTSVILLFTSATVFWLPSIMIGIGKDVKKLIKKR